MPRERPPSPQHVARWIITAPPRCGLHTSERLDRLLAHCPELNQAHDLVQDFAAILETQDAAPLPDWLERLATSRLAPLTSLAKAIREDQPAVDQGITTPFNSGVNEGRITDRAGVPLLHPPRRAHGPPQTTPRMTERHQRTEAHPRFTKILPGPSEVVRGHPIVRQPRDLEPVQPQEGHALHAHQAEQAGQSACPLFRHGRSRPSGPSTRGRASRRVAQAVRDDLCIGMFAEPVSRHVCMPASQDLSMILVLDADSEGGRLQHSCQVVGGLCGFGWGPGDVWCLRGPGWCVRLGASGA
uniref:transposase n=1 Tax=Streptomyces polyasparticus TaxID=2767826 RepID=UPI001BE4446A|nr:transposase [Streptomyces polyasparticus]